MDGKPMPDDKMTTTDAGALLGIRPSSVKGLCQRGTIAAEKRGRDWWITPAEVERYRRERRGVGRPKKETGRKATARDDRAEGRRKTMIETSGAYTKEQIASQGISPELDDMKVFELMENPDAGCYIGGSWLGAQRWAVALGGTATIIGTVAELRANV
jgi:hypothetical protein